MQTHMSFIALQSMFLWLLLYMQYCVQADVTWAWPRRRACSSCRVSPGSILPVLSLRYQRDKIMPIHDFL